MKLQRNSLLKTLMLVGAFSSSVAFAADSVATPPPPPPAAVAPTQQPACKMSDPVADTKVMVAAILDVLSKDQGAIKGNFLKVEEDISNILSPRIDIARIAAFVAPAVLMKSATPADQLAFQKVLLYFFISSYSTAFSSFNSGVTVTVNPLRAGMEQKETIQINTVVNTDSSGNPNSMIPVALVLTRDPIACQWKYLDFVVDGISGVASVQSQIASIKVKTLPELTSFIQQHNTDVAKGM